MSAQLDWSASIDLDRGSRKPLSGQLAAAIERRIASGALPEGARLPATRDLAAALKINRGTVQAAYRHLQEPGLARAVSAAEPSFTLRRRRRRHSIWIRFSPRAS